MESECNQRTFGFHVWSRREVVGGFNGGRISSDGGGILLKQVDDRLRIVEQFAACFSDHRDPEMIEFTVADLLRQRIFGLCLGYEDLNDHDALRHDTLLAVMVGRDDVEGNARRSPQDRGIPLAGKSTLNRLELSRVGADAGSRYQKIPLDVRRAHNLLVDLFLQQHARPPERIVLDLDATDDPVHGNQLGRFYHGYYRKYCFLPLYVFCGDHPLLALLRPADIDASAGAVKHLARIIERIRQQWPSVRILVRGDSGFCRESLMVWCEQNNVDYLFGLARNRVLQRILGREMHQAKQQFEATGTAARIFKDFCYRTQKSWSRERRVVGKAEYLRLGENPRFVVTSLSVEEFDARALYENEYCSRGEMENRIKEQQLMLFADRTSCQTLRANQLRLLLSTVAYSLMRALREFGLKDTPLEHAQADTIRLQLLKIGTQVRVTVRRVWLAFSEAYPWQTCFMQVYDRLAAWAQSSGTPLVTATG